MNDFLNTLNDYWSMFIDRLSYSVVMPDNTVVLVGLLLFAASLVWLPKVWKWTGYFETVVHEAGHALAALMVGSRLHGIKIRLNHSGETVSSGSRFLPFRVWTTFWGYPFPALLGALYIWSCYGYQGVAITFTLLLSVLLFLQIRSFVAFISITLMMVGVSTIWYLFPPDWLSVVLYTFGWFLIFGGFNSLINLTKHHIDGNTESSDANHLQRMTFVVPSVVWLVLFYAVTFGSALFAFNIVFLK